MVHLGEFLISISIGSNLNKMGLNGCGYDKCQIEKQTERYLGNTLTPLGCLNALNLFLSPKQFPGFYKFADSFFFFLCHGIFTTYKIHIKLF